MSPFGFLESGISPYNSRHTTTVSGHGEHGTHTQVAVLSLYWKDSYRQEPLNPGDGELVSFGEFAFILQFKKHSTDLVNLACKFQRPGSNSSLYNSVHNI